MSVGVYSARITTYSVDVYSSRHIMKIGVSSHKSRSVVSEGGTIACNKNLQIFEKKQLNHNEKPDAKLNITQNCLIYSTVSSKIGAGR